MTARRGKPVTKAAPALTHVDAAGRPAMVDVSSKAVTARRAVAECLVRFPADVAAALRASKLRGRKGPILDTAIVAGVMAAKRTHELVPFCHPLALEDCRVRGAFVDRRTLRIECEVAVTARTGVEMEALTGATVAALVVYDMTKALSHAIEVGPARLVEKRGGKSDYSARKR
jgi:cyclic pyranopterin phosphate synthase